MKAPLVSVLVTTYNLQRYIDETLAAILAQDYPNLEIIVADDGSTDGTLDILKGYAARDSRITLALNEKNRGFAENANSGLRLVSGKYFVLHDGDDVILSGKISAQVAWMEEDDKRILCGHDAEVFFDDNSKPPYLHSRGSKLRSKAPRICYAGREGLPGRTTGRL